MEYEAIVANHIYLYLIDFFFTEEETEEDETDTPRDTPSRLRKPGSRSGGSRSSMSASSVSPSRGDRSRNRLVPSSSSALKGSSRSSSRLSASTVRTVRHNGCNLFVL